MKKSERIIALQVLLSFVFVILFWLSGYYFIYKLDFVNDEVFIFNHFLIGFYQWLYTLPIIFYLKKRGKVFLGFLIGGIVLTLLNISLFVWILVDPSFFF